MFMGDIKLYAKDQESLQGLAQTVRVVGGDIGMVFGVKKFVVLVLIEVK